MLFWTDSDFIHLGKFLCFYSADAEIAVWPNTLNKNVQVFIKKTTSFGFDLPCTRSSREKIPEIWLCLLCQGAARAGHSTKKHKPRATTTQTVVSPDNRSITAEQAGQNKTADNWFHRQLHTWGGGE